MRIKETEENLKPKIKKLNLGVIEEAETFLKSEDLLNSTNKLIGKSGVIGKEINR